MRILIQRVLLLIFTNILLSQESNPCEDARYLEIKDKPLDEMSDREYEYFSRKDGECSQYKLKLPTQPENTGKQPSPKTVSEKMEVINLYGNTEYLTPSQKQRFTRERLTVEIIAKTRGSAAATPLGNSVIANYGSETTRKWKASKGFEEISEEAFLRIAGYDKEADVVMEYISTNKTFMWGGLAAMVVGIPFYSNGYQMSMDAIDEYYLEDDEMYKTESAKADNKVVTGIILISGGLGAAYYGILNLGKNRYEYSVVDGISEDYNKKLIARIKESSE